VRNGDFTVLTPHSAAAKGQTIRNFDFGVSVSGGYTTLSLTSLRDRLNAHFEPFGDYFDITVAPDFPSGLPSGGLTARAVIREKYLVQMGVRYMSYRDEKNYVGRYTPSFSESACGYRFRIAHDLEMITNDISVAFSIPRPVIRYFYVGGGVVIFNTKYSVRTAMTDSLFTADVSSEYEEKGVCVLPSLLLGADYPLIPFLHIGASARYRYQKAPSALQFNNSTTTVFIPGREERKTFEPFQYDFGGFDITLFTLIQFTSFGARQ
jgi:hypothetical protein